jgi:hypothetical protein
MTPPPVGRYAQNFLLELFTNPLDPGYADAAEARRRHGPRPRWRRVGAYGLRTLILVVVGFLLAVAYREQASAEPERSRAHAGLVEEVKTGQDRTDALQAQSDQLRREVTAAQQAALGGSAEELARVREQQAAAWPRSLAQARWSGSPTPRPRSTRTPAGPATWKSAGSSTWTCRRW